MRAIVAYTEDGTITSLALGGGFPEAEGNFVAEVDLPQDFPDLSGENAEEDVVKALSGLIVQRATATLRRRA